MSGRMRAGFVVPRGEGRSLRNPVGGSIELKAVGEQTGGALSMLETVAATGEGPPLHVHDDADETIYVLDGLFRIRIEDEVYEAPPGTFAFLPRRITHTWQNRGETEGRLLAMFTPASTGMEQFFEQFAETRDASPSEAFSALAPAAGMTVLGPPLARSHPL